jgi:flagellar biosynthetic protein FliR
LILFSGAQLAGQILSQLSGMSIAEAFDPDFDSSVSSFTQLLDWVAMSIFVCIGGHRQVLAALLDTFRWMPPGQGGCSNDLVDMLVEITTQSFVTGIRASAPVMVALLLAVLVTGLISRTLPQLNVMAIGFNINAFVLLGTFGITLGGAAWVFQEHLDATLDGIMQVFVMQKQGLP